jgi:hypothetical protein
MLPRWSKMIARVLVVPWSIASRYWLMVVFLSLHKRKNDRKPLS